MSNPNSPKQKNRFRISLNEKFSKNRKKSEDEEIKKKPIEVFNGVHVMDEKKRIEKYIKEYKINLAIFDRYKSLNAIENKLKDLEIQVNTTNKSINYMNKEGIIQECEELVRIRDDLNDFIDIYIVYIRDNIEKIIANQQPTNPFL